MPRHDRSLTPALSQWERETWSAFGATFTVSNALPNASIPALSPRTVSVMEQDDRLFVSWL